MKPDIVFIENPLNDHKIEVQISSGKIGPQGLPGVSPIATVEQIDQGAIVTIIDKNGTTSATVLNGKDGDSVDINVVKDTPAEYIVEFITSSKRIQSPNLKSENESGDIRQYYISASNSDIESIFN